MTCFAVFLIRQNSSTVRQVPGQGQSKVTQCVPKGSLHHPSFTFDLMEEEKRAEYVSLQSTWYAAIIDITCVLALVERSNVEMMASF